jgi:hypothetical protein
VAGSSPDKVDFLFNLPNLSSCTMALWSAELLTEMSTRNLPGVKRRPALKADSLTAICEPMVGASNSHILMGLHGLLQG